MTVINRLGKAVGRRILIVERGTEGAALIEGLRQSVAAAISRHVGNTNRPTVIGAAVACVGDWRGCDAHRRPALR